MISMAGSILEYVRANPMWVARFLVVYVGNPIVFFIYAATFLIGTNTDGKKIFGIRTFQQVQTNVTKVNVLLYILLTLPLYLAWILLQVAILSKCAPQNFKLDSFLASLVSIGALVAAVPGLLNIYVWSTSGMEGNVMGFIFALPLLAASIAYFALWIYSIVVSLSPSAADDALEVRQYSPVNPS